MLLFKALIGFKHRVFMGLAILLCLAATGCMRPLYGTSSGGKSTIRELFTVEVAPIPDLAGHYLREELLFALAGGTDTALEHKYTLTVTLKERTISAAVDTTSGRADAAALQLTALFVLTDAKGKKLLESSAFATASVDRLSQRFAAVRAQREARIQVAKVVAEQIQTNLAAFFSSQS